MQKPLTPPMDPRRRFLLILTAITCILFLVALLPRSPKQSTTPKPTPIPTSAPLAAKKTAIEQLPIKGTGFSIEYLNSSDTFIISLTNPSAEFTALNWLSTRGVSKENSTILINSFRPHF